MTNHDKEALLPTHTVRRLCLSLIAAEQADLITSGHATMPFALRDLDPAIDDETLDALRIDGDGLGFDSLGRLRLILRLNRFFGLSATGIEDYLVVKPTLGDWVELIAEHLRRVGPAAVFTFSTSGSSGPPRHVPHGLTSLSAEVKALLDGPLHGAARPRRVLAMVPPHHAYGFIFTCLLPQLAGCDVVDIHRSGPGTALRLARPGDLITGTPFNWNILAQADQRVPPGVAGATSGAPAGPETWDAAEQLGLSRLVEVYGATETAGVGWRDDGSLPFELLSHLERCPQGIHDPSRHSEMLPLQDHILWHGPRQFSVEGRLDQAFQVGGVNVSPAAVSACLRQLDGVAEVIIRPHAGRIKAFVVPADTHATADLERVLAAHAHKFLAAPARPVHYTFGPSVPRNAMGKICDWEPILVTGITEP